MKIRRLNQAGLEKFDKFLTEVKQGTQQNIPSWILEDDKTSEEIEFDIHVDESKIFPTRFDFGKFLVDKFDKQNIQKYMGDTGFWSWIVLCWFDQFAPMKNDGVRPLRKKYNYILSRDYRHRTRHAAYMSWLLVSKYDENSRFMLCNAMSVRGDIPEQILARQHIISCENVIKTASRLYTDEKTKRYKRGASGNRGGSVRRFVDVLQQLELTYDLFMIEQNDFEKLLPPEFNKFKAV